MIILEGCDGSGKTTLLNNFKELNYFGTVAQKPTFTNNILVNRLNFYYKTAPLYQNSIIDRFYLSELVYSKLKNDRVNYSTINQPLYESYLMGFFPVIIYTDPGLDEIKKNIQNRGDDYIKDEEISNLYNIYNEYLDKSIIPIFRYNYLKDDPKEFIKKVLHYYNNYYSKYLLFNNVLSSGNYLMKDNIMIIEKSLSDDELNNGDIKFGGSYTVNNILLFKELEDYGFLDKKVIPYFTVFDKGAKTKEEKYDIIKMEIYLLEPKFILVRDESLLFIEDSELYTKKRLEEIIKYY